MVRVDLEKLTRNYAGFVRKALKRAAGGVHTDFYPIYDNVVGTTEFDFNKINY